MARHAPRLVLSDDERLALRRCANAASAPQALAFRARLVLRCAAPDDPPNSRVAAELGCDADTVCKWRARFRDRRLGGLRDLPRSGRPAAFSPGGPAQGLRPGHAAAR